MAVTRSSKKSRNRRDERPNRDERPTRAENTTRVVARQESEVWVAKRLEGGFPPLTVHSRTVPDPRGGKVFVYGGYMPNDETKMPMPFLHVFDTKAKKFTDLTNALTFITPGDPYSEAMLKREVKPLPSLVRPAMIFVEFKGHPIIFMFGVHDTGDGNGPSAALVAVNTKYKEWYFVEFEDNELPVPSPRTDSTLVEARGKLYIFGGITEIGDMWNYQRSYSVIDLKHDTSTHKCRWLAVDNPYPNNVPPSQLFGEGVAVQNGSMILLLPDGKQTASSLHFERDNIFYFVTANNTFQKADLQGPLPREISWYYACEFDPTFGPEGHTSSSAANSASPSIILCTWLPHGPEDLSPEFWQFKPHPENRFTRLGISERVYALEKNFQRFALVGDRAFLMGQGDDEDGEEGAMCDTYVEIPIRELL